MNEIIVIQASIRRFIQLNSFNLYKKFNYKYFTKKRKK